MVNRKDFCGQLHNIEQVDLITLEKILPQYYTPSENPCGMVVGALMLHEATLLRFFHHNVYGIKDVKVVGTNLQPIPEDLSIIDHYDVRRFGGFSGDASQDSVWCLSLGEVSNCGKEKYDISYIRNPNLANLCQDNWITIFGRALSWTAEQGAVVTIIRSNDADGYQDFLEKLKTMIGIEPVYSDKISLDGIESLHGSQFHHTIGIFKPNGEFY